MSLCLTAENTNRCVNYSLTIGCVDWTKGYNFTFRDYDGSVQYGIFCSVLSALKLRSLCCFWIQECFCRQGALLPPKKLCSHFQNGSDARKGKCAILLALHGAGVDATSPFWIGAFNQQDFAWVYKSICLCIVPFVSLSMSKWITISFWFYWKDFLTTLFWIFFVEVLFPTGRRPWGYDWHGNLLINQEIHPLVVE
jgi:hypothetical protein